MLHCINYRVLLLSTALCIVGRAAGQGPTVTLVPSDYNGYNISCFGMKDGAITATITGGVAPYTYQWTNGATEPNLANVAAGYYKLVVQDANSNYGSAEITLTEPTALKVSAVPFKYPSGFHISCFECFNGSIDVAVAHGVAPYSYDWGDEVYTQDRTALGALDYQVKVTDANMCSEQSELITLKQPVPKDWTMEGNANTDANTDFFGTTDAQDVVFKSNGQELVRLTSGGQVKLPGIGSTGVLGIDAGGVLGPVPGLGNGPGNNAVPCAQDVFPFWRTGGNELTTCDPTRAVLGSLDARHVNFITNNDVRMRLTAGGQMQIGGDLEEWPETDAAGRVNILQGNGNWLTLKTQGATPGSPSAYWGLHNPPEQDRLTFYHQPVSGNAIWNMLSLHSDGRLSSHELSTFPNGTIGMGTTTASAAGMRVNVLGGLHADKLVLGDVTAPAGYSLCVKNGIISEKMKVAASASLQWSDFVFDEGYALMSLPDVKKYVKENKHLPGVASQLDIRSQGNDLHSTDAALLMKIEELYLHIFALNEVVESMKTRIQELETPGMR